MADGNPLTQAVVKPSLTPIAPLSHKGARAPIPQRPEQLWVNVRDLRVDHAYQRKLGERSATLIRKMVEGWDWTLVQAITVAELPGGLWEVIDGRMGSGEPVDRLSPTAARLRPSARHWRRMAGCAGERQRMDREPQDVHDDRDARTAADPAPGDDLDAADGDGGADGMEGDAMSDEIRTPAEALEEAAQVAFAAMIRGNSANVAEEIRALAARIPERDDEALVEDVAEALRRINPNAPSREQARAVLAALRLAGALK